MTSGQTRDNDDDVLSSYFAFTLLIKATLSLSLYFSSLYNSRLNNICLTSAYNTHPPSGRRFLLLLLLLHVLCATTRRAAAADDEWMEWSLHDIFTGWGTVKRRTPTPTVGTCVSRLKRFIIIFIHLVYAVHNDDSGSSSSKKTRQILRKESLFLLLLL